MLIPKLSKRRNELIKKCIFCMVVSLMAVGLKYHYSHASSDDLAWILGPTAGVVEYLSGIAFEKEGGAGFVNRANRIVIAPSCAGVNFLIIAFCMAAFSGLYHLKSSLLKIFWLGNSAVWAYILTIAVNAFRIVASIYLYNADIYYHGLTPERLHRIEGIFIYFFFLCLFYVTLDKTMGFCTRNRIPGHKKRIPEHSDSKKSRHALFIPLFWYLLICLGIPILNRGYLENVPQFAEHCRVVLSVCMVVFLIVFLIQSGCQLLWGKVQFYLKSITVGGSTVKDRF